MKVTADTDLIIRMQQNDTAAFDQLYWRYHAPLFHNILKLVKDKEIANDILQEVFIALWERRSTIRAEQSVANWLFVVSYNKSVTAIKQSLKVAPLQEKDAVGVALPEETELKLQDKQFEVLEQAMQVLSVKQRQVFERCKLEGRKYEEVAAELNISRNTVKEYLAIAILKIRQYIEANPEYLMAFLFPSLMQDFFF